MNLNLINIITSTYLVTVINKYTTEHQQDKNFRQNPFTSIDNQLPSSLLSHSVINAVTIQCKIWQKQTTTKYKLIIYDDADIYLYLFKLFESIQSNLRHGNLVFD